MSRTDKIKGWRSHRMMKGPLKLATDIEGLAVTEFALIIGVVSMALLSAVDITRYYRARSEVENATQMAAQLAWKSCDVTKLPAATNCPEFLTSINAGLHSTSLGTNVVLKQNFPSEGYYCIDTAGVLKSVSDISSRPDDCSSVGNGSAQPVEYVQIQTSYTYRPLFSGISIGSLLPSTITSTSMMRME
jgi:hypothetical protein